VAQYKITGPDGNSYQITAPDNAKQEDVLAYAKANYSKAAKPEPTDWKQVVGTAAKEAFTRPMAAAKDLGTNPTTMAQALPPLMGMAGGFSPIPGGATMGTVGGRQISNAALRALGKPELIPSGMQQVGEAGLSAIGDIAAIPAMKKAYYGGQIGKAEVAAGVQNIEKEAPPSGMRTAVKFIQALKNKMNTENLTPLEARRIKPAIDTIFRKGWLEGTEYSSDAADVSKRISTLVNQIPGRAAPSAAMARAMTVPNAVGKLTPPPVRRAITYGFGQGVGGGTGFELIRRLLGG
jgi:hypothetical protein